jgi:hypothetical protein
VTVPVRDGPPFDSPNDSQYNAQRAYLRTLGSWEPEITRLAQLHGFAVYRYGNRIRTHNPEATGSNPVPAT